MATYFGFEPTSVSQEHIFVSYSRFNSDEVAPIVKVMGEQYPVWYDEGLIPGSEWETTVTEEIIHCKAAVFFIGKSLFEHKEGYVCREARLVCTYQKPAICVWLDDMDELNQNHLSHDNDMLELWQRLRALPSVKIYDKSTVEEQAATVITAVINQTTATNKASFTPNSVKENKAVNTSVANAVPPPETKQVFTSTSNMPVAEPNFSTVNHSNGSANIKKLFTVVIPLAVLLIIAANISKFTKLFNSNTDSNTTSIGSYEYLQQNSSQTKKAKNIEDIKSVNDVKVGDLIYFGAYEQDGDESNGDEPIAWQVLDIQNGELLMLTDLLLAREEYAQSGFSTYYHATTTWEYSELRWWMNEKFYERAFTPEEQKRILTKTISTLDTPDPFGEYIDGGNDTEDKIFALSIDEAEKYFPTPESRVAYQTEAISGHNWADSGFWWLRSRNYTHTESGDYDYYDDLGYASVVSYDGDILGSYMGGTECVRPALWVNL